MRAELVREAPDVEQAGAICFRVNGKGQLQVLLVGSLRNGHWGLPKGHVEPDESTEHAAIREAFEEAGVVGTLSSDVFGIYLYSKESTKRQYCVSVHLMRVKRRVRDFPESGIRKSQWFLIGDAINLAAQPGVKTLLAKFRDDNSGDLATGSDRALHEESLLRLD